MYYYPDGTKSSRKPRDGEKFVLVGPAGAIQSTWQWDDILMCWQNISSGKPNKHNTVTFTIAQPPPGDWTYELRGEVHPLHVLNGKCQCGSEAIGSPRHSSWCDKYSPQQ